MLLIPHLELIVLVLLEVAEGEDLVDVIALGMDCSLLTDVFWQLWGLFSFLIE